MSKNIKITLHRSGGWAEGREQTISSSNTEANMFRRMPVENISCFHTALCGASSNQRQHWKFFKWVEPKAGIKYNILWEGLIRVCFLSPSLLQHLNKNWFITELHSILTKTTLPLTLLEVSKKKKKKNLQKLNSHSTILGKNAWKQNWKQSIFKQSNTLTEN